jgi:hypothetical protein
MSERQVKALRKKQQLLKSKGISVDSKKVERKHEQQGFVTYYSWPLALLCLKKNADGAYSLVMNQIVCSAQDFPKNVVAIPPAFKDHTMAKWVMIVPLPQDMDEINRESIEAQIKFYNGLQVESYGKDLKLVIKQKGNKPSVPVAIQTPQPKQEEEKKEVVK